MHRAECAAWDSDNNMWSAERCVSDPDGFAAGSDGVADGAAAAAALRCSCATGLAADLAAIRVDAPMPPPPPPPVIPLTVASSEAITTLVPPFPVMLFALMVITGLDIASLVMVWFRGRKPHTAPHKDKDDGRGGGGRDMGAVAAKYAVDAMDAEGGAEGEEGDDGELDGEDDQDEQGEQEGGDDARSVTAPRGVQERVSINALVASCQTLSGGTAARLSPSPLSPLPLPSPVTPLAAAAARQGRVPRALPRLDLTPSPVETGGSSALRQSFQVRRELSPQVKSSLEDTARAAREEVTTRSDVDPAAALAVASGRVPHARRIAATTAAGGDAAGCLWASPRQSRLPPPSKRAPGSPPPSPPAPVTVPEDDGNDDDDNDGRPPPRPPRPSHIILPRRTGSCEVCGGWLGRKPGSLPLCTHPDCPGSMIRAVEGAPAVAPPAALPSELEGEGNPLALLDSRLAAAATQLGMGAGAALAHREPPLPPRQGAAPPGPGGRRVTMCRERLNLSALQPFEEPAQKPPPPPPLPRQQQPEARRPPPGLPAPVTAKRPPPSVPAGVTPFADAYSAHPRIEYGARPYTLPPPKRPSAAPSGGVRHASAVAPPAPLPTLAFERGRAAVLPPAPHARATLPPLTKLPSVGPLVAAKAAEKEAAAKKAAAAAERAAAEEARRKAQAELEAAAMAKAEMEARQREERRARRARRWAWQHVHTLRAALRHDPPPGAMGATPASLSRLQRTQLPWNAVVAALAAVCVLGEWQIWTQLTVGAACSVVASLVCRLVFLAGNGGASAIAQVQTAAPRARGFRKFRAKAMARGATAWALVGVLYLSTCAACAWTASGWTTTRMVVAVRATALALVVAWSGLEPALLLLASLYAETRTFGL